MTMILGSAAMIKVRHVQQPTLHTCGHACLSMVTGIPVADLIARFGDRGIGEEEETTVLTEMGILPVQVPRGLGHPMPLVGVYLLTLPSLNRPGQSHRVVVEEDLAGYTLFDPNEGRGDVKAYARDCMNTGADVSDYSDITYLRPLSEHKGIVELRRLYGTDGRRSTSGEAA